MPTTVQIPVTGDYREVILPAGYADYVRCLLVGGDHLFLCTDTQPGSLLKIRKDDFSVRSVVTFPDDTEHKNAIDAVYVPGSVVANDRIYVLFAWGAATPGLLMISEVNPNTGTNDTPTITNEDYVREEDFTPGVAGCLSTDNTNLYVLSGYIDPIRIATVRLSDANVWFSPALSPDPHGWVMRVDSGRLYAVGKTLDEFGDTWVKKINVQSPHSPLSPSVEHAITIADGTDFYAMAEDIGVSSTHLWIGRRGNPTVAGIIKKVDKSSFAVTDFATGINGPCRIVRNAGSFIWGLYDNGKAVRINPTAGTKSIYTLNDGQGFQSQINTDADAFLYTAWNQSGTKIARYHIPPDAEPGDTNWVATVTSVGLTQDSALAVTSDLSGNASFVGSFSLGPAIYIARYDSDGNEDWATTSGTGRGTAVAVDAVGDLFVASSFSGDSFKVEKRSRINGDLIWEKIFGGSTPTSIAITSDGHLVITGFFSSVDFGDGTMTGAFSGSTFVAKLSSVDGSYILARQFGEELSSGRAIGVDSSGNFWIAGYFYQNISFDGQPWSAGTGKFGGYLVKLNGTTQARMFSLGFTGGPFQNGNTLFYGANGVAIAPNNDVAITGAFRGTLNLGGQDFTSSATGINSYFARFNNAGVHQWSYMAIPTIDSPIPSSGQGLGATCDNSGNGNTIFTGRMFGKVDYGNSKIIQATAPLTSQSNTFVVKYDSAGTCQWAKNFTGNNSGRGIKADPLGRSLVVGDWGGTCNFGTGDRTATGGDLFLVQLAP